MRNKGFTLIELSIVLIIISLIVGGIVSGKSLIRASEIKSVISEINSYETAFRTFEDQYEYAPGDLPNAKDYWPDPLCLDSGTQLCNGNGDRMLTNETFRAWQHLELAEMVEGAFTGLLVASLSGCDLDENCPSSSLKHGGYQIIPLTTGGISLLLGADVPGLFLLGGIITPREAKNFDRKMDDGISDTGRVIGMSSLSGTCISGGVYDLSISEDYCVIQFKIN